MLTPQQLKDFEQSEVWAAMRAEINIRISARHLELEDPDGVQEIADIHRAQGGVKAYKEIRDNILETLLRILEEGKEVNG